MNKLPKSESNKEEAGGESEPATESKILTQDLRKAVTDRRKAVRQARGGLAETVRMSRDAIRDADTKLRR